jgi:hypothetical protein
VFQIIIKVCSKLLFNCALNYYSSVFQIIITVCSKLVFKRVPKITTYTQIQKANPKLNFVLVLDYKPTVFKTKGTQFSKDWNAGAISRKTKTLSASHYHFIDKNWTQISSYIFSAYVTKARWFSSHVLLQNGFTSSNVIIPSET